MFRFVKGGAIEYLEAEEISALGFVTHAFCTRQGGVSEGPFADLNVGDRVGDREEDVRRNLTLVGEAFSIREGRLMLMRQIHGNSIRVIDGDSPLPAAAPGPPSAAAATRWMPPSLRRFHPGGRQDVFSSPARRKTGGCSISPLP